MIFSAAAALLMAGTVPAVATSATAYAVAPVPAQDAKIEVNIGNDSDEWYTNPVWLAIGAVALIAVVGLIVASRGKTAIVK